MICTPLFYALCQSQQRLDSTIAEPIANIMQLHYRRMFLTYIFIQSLTAYHLVSALVPQYWNSNKNMTSEQINVVNSPQIRYVGLWAFCKL